MTAEERIASAVGPDGRDVELLESTWEHVLAGHLEMAEYLDAMIDTVENPELREDDPRPGRSRSLRRCGPERWLRVVVEFRGEKDAIVTAFPQANDPAGWRK